MFDAQKHLNHDSERLQGDKLARKYDPEQFRRLLSRIQALDVAYMRQAGVLDDEGFADGEYDDDDAFEQIVDGLAEQVGDEEATRLGELVDAYMEATEDFFEEEGVLHWE